MPNRNVSKTSQFLTYFGKNGKAPNLANWEYGVSEFKRDTTFDSVTSVHYRFEGNYIARAESNYREGFYGYVISVGGEKISYRGVEEFSSINFEDFYRRFQKSLRSISTYIKQADGENSSPERSLNNTSYLHFLFMDTFGENGTFISNPGWLKDDVLESLEDPGLSSFFYISTGKGNRASILVLTDYKDYEAIMEVYSNSVLQRSEAKSKIENIQDLEEVIINYMKIAELDLKSRRS